ncbi:hypothetical protein ACQKKG_08340 [Brevundimonas sp. NPDC003935]|uniref:hypothetical protein n=1 Tax=unclassified Brevundimonas TaxID=2622653 RepID=UPI00289F56D3|nr:hypothetical protein [Brevundimonas sp.]
MRHEDEVSPIQDRRHLTDSRPIRWDREAATSRASAAIDALLDDLEAWEPKRARRRRAADRGRLRVILEAVTLELWLARRDTPTRWLAYSRGDLGYVGPDRYRHPEASKTTVTLVADFLTSTGLAEGRAGSYRREDHGFAQSGKGYLSRLRGTDALLPWADGQGLADDDVALNDRFELIRLKGQAKTRRGRKPLLHYDDTPDTTAMRDRLRSWAAMMAGHEVTLGSDGTSGEKASGARLDDPLSDAEEFQARGAGSCRLYRIFNDGSWDRGGRFYGGWWQGLSKADRERLLIDGEETVELDFASLHPRLCYQLNGAPLAAGDDPYAVPGVPEELRDVVKVAMMQLLNAQPGKARVKAPPGATARLKGRMSYKALAAHLEARHSGISNWFRQGLRGLELQAIDAAIADVVMNYFTVAMKRPVLPVHDSFIVARRDERTLAETMALAYQGQLSRLVAAPAAPVIRGFSSDEEEAAFLAYVARWS